MERQFTIQASTINGDFKEFPEPIILRCGEVFPVGIMDVIDPLFNGDILKRKVFVVRQGLDLFGTFEFEDEDEWNEFVDSRCCIDCSEESTFTFKFLEPLKITNVADIYTGRNSRRAILTGTAQSSNSFLVTATYVVRKKYVRIEVFTTPARTVPQHIGTIQEQAQGTTSWVNKDSSWTVVSVGVIEKLFTQNELPNIRIFG